jgi:aryl carrier-like protein
VVRLEGQTTDRVIAGFQTSDSEHRVAQEILLGMLGVLESDFDPNLPLVLYGLDSLSTSRLATVLRPQSDGPHLRLTR